ncbi:MAG: DUF2842 domain-containing protein [Rhizobiales bacterium]|nr:DUF2842 domain-containing protein [Hyphomicrobiales bacterium]
MPARLRKLIGTIVLLVYITIYALLAMVVGARVLEGASGAVEFLYYMVAGLAWVPIAGLLVTWMETGRFLPARRRRDGSATP